MAKGVWPWPDPFGSAVWIQNFTSVNAFFHTFFAFAVSLVVGYLASFCFTRPATREQLEGLTVWDLKSSPLEQSH